MYTTEHNYMDFNVDDNGLWVIYATADSNNTHIAKVSTSLVHQYNIKFSDLGLKFTNLYSSDHRIIVETFKKLFQSYIRFVLKCGGISTPTVFFSIQLDCLEVFYQQIILSTRRRKCKKK